MSQDTSPRIVAVNRGVEDAAGEVPRRGPQHEALTAWVGRWINEGHLVEDDGTPGLRIVTSDVYEWAPGGFFLLHQAYGRVGPHEAGAIEMIGWDDERACHTSHLFDSQGNVAVSTLVADGNTWTYRGDTTRATVEFSADHRVQTVLHERTDDGSTYVTSMRVTLTKVG